MSNEKQQTAVDFLMDKLFDPSMMVDEQVKWFEQAKEIEKEQIKSAFNIGELMAHDYFYGNYECAENYYNETYGGNK